MKLRYFMMDVFTRTRLTGNPLAVVEDADALSTARMQLIASEFNLSETVFIRSPENSRHAASLKIFTPKIELPFAGHPTIGAAVLLGLQTRISAVRVELGVGLVTAVTDKIDKRTGMAKFALPVPPRVDGDVPETEVFAKALGLPLEAIGCDGMVPALYSAGVPFYLVPVRDTKALAEIQLERRGVWGAFTKGQGALYAFTKTDNDREFDLAARMFSPRMGIGEDPATGSAASALIGLLSDQAGLGDGSHQFKLRQGREMGRPSRIDLQFSVAEGALQRSGIGGDAVIVAEGTIDLDD